jgi:phosphoglycerate dehydrogenase-like enzyme
VTLASVPSTDALDYLTGRAAGVDLVVWDGLGPRPPGAEDVEFFVGRYNAPPPEASVLGDLPRLRVVQLLSAGVEPWLPVVPPGVQLCNGRGVHGASTAELAVAGLLSLLRGLPTFLDQQRAHRWQRQETEGVTGRRVVILGAGDIGRRVAAALVPFDAEPVLVARTARDDVHAMSELPGLLPEAEAVVVALPRTPETDGMVDAKFLAALPDGAVVVNVSRGPLVDTSALLAELRSGRLHAVLDVTDPEPLPSDHPLWDAPNLILTPHVGGGTRGWERRAYTLVAEQLQRYVAGEPLENRVEHGF